jgi:hypothetical protein
MTLPVICGKKLSFNNYVTCNFFYCNLKFLSLSEYFINTRIFVVKYNIASSYVYIFTLFYVLQSSIDT